jgi:Ca-activated chloride channel family protein
MAKVHRRIGTPIATESSLRATGLELDRATIAPAKLPDISPGRRDFGAIAVAPGNATIDVEATSLGEPWKMSVAPSRPPRASTWLAACWARAHLRDLEDRYVAGARELEPQIVRVSKQCSVLSRFTAFVAIDRSQVVNAGGVLHQAVQPVEMPAGWAATAGSSSMPYGPPAMAMPFAGPPAAPVTQSFVAGASPATLGEIPPARRSPAPAQSEEFRLRLSEVMPRPPTIVRATIDPSRLAPQGPIASPPPRPPQGPSVSPPMMQPHVTGAAMSAPVLTIYLRRLVVIAVELAAMASDPDRIRGLRLRLIQWIEDLRSVGGNRDLAAAVEDRDPLVEAPSGSTVLSADVESIAVELAALGSGKSPPPKSRPAFWK